MTSISSAANGTTDVRDGILAAIVDAPGAEPRLGAVVLPAVEVHTFPLDELPAAWRAQAASLHAKCVVLPKGAPRRHAGPYAGNPGA